MDICQREKAAVEHWSVLTQSLGYSGEAPLSFADGDRLADTQIRFPAFLLATHYWEGRWLIDMARFHYHQQDKSCSTIKNAAACWRRRMKLTPCVVMTCYMLPNYLTINGQVYGSKPAEIDYLYNFVDLLIVDEAGQMLTEVAAASFAFAKKALVIGDTEQTAPIWKSATAIDIGNMLEANLLREGTQEELKQAYHLICDSGKSAACGSVMKVAQFNSRYQYDGDLARGMYLYEHRRCLDDIISYCNRLCYHGKLQPKRGNKNNALFPAIGYLHIDGKCLRAHGGSSYNRLEAEIITTWLVAHKENIEHYYKKSLAEVVAIVTPFSAQANTIKQMLQKQGIATGLTVGTVHGLQGAERLIVLFSPVYSKHMDGNFN